MNRSEFIKRHRSFYYHVLIYNRDLLDEVFPNLTKVDREMFIEYIKMHGQKPNQKHKNYAVFAQLMSPTHKRYDKKFADEVNSFCPPAGLVRRQALESEYYSKGLIPRKGEKLYKAHQSMFVSQKGSEWSESMRSKYPFLISRMERAHLSFLKLMPDRIKLADGQPWKGTSSKYAFIDEEFGEFRAVASKLTCRAWKEGRGGHPQEGRIAAELAKMKKVVCIELQRVFLSFKDARKIVSKGNLHRSINERKTCGGYHWAYYDEEIHGPIIEKDGNNYASKLKK